ncbi:BSD domain-containing family protein [Salix suchowensis]|nr:BSD domain-containing family protein [Salix suchowensis]
MDWSSWLRRSVSSSKNSRNPDNKYQNQKEEEEEQLGITQQLIDHVKSFTVDTFKNFPLQDEAASSSSSFSTTTSSNVQRDLSEWQERQLVMFFPKTRIFCT